MWKLPLRHRYVVPNRFSITILKRNNSSDIELRFDRLIWNIIHSDDLLKIPKSKEAGLEKTIRNFIKHPDETNLIQKIRQRNNDDFLNVLESDDTYLIQETIDFIKKNESHRRDNAVLQKRANLQRRDPPLNIYAIFLKYIYEPVPDITLIEKYYDRLPHPQPLYIKHAHFETMMRVLLNANVKEFFIKVVSGLRDAGCNLTLRERSRLISNALRVGESPLLSIYEFIKLKMVLDNVKLYNGILEYCAHSKDNDDLFSLVLKDMAAMNIKPDHECFNYMVRHLGKSAMNQENLVILLEKLCEDDSFAFDIQTINSLILSCFVLKRDQTALDLLKWLLKLTELKGHIDLSLESLMFLEDNNDLLEFVRRQMMYNDKIVYLPNIDEETSHICIRECSKRANKDGNIDMIMEILDILQRYDLVLWETTYKLIFTSLSRMKSSCFSLEQVQKILKHLMDTHRATLPFLFSNPDFRHLVLTAFRKKTPNPLFTHDLDAKERYMIKLFEEFYKQFPDGFQTTEQKKQGSTRYHEIIMTSIIEEFEDLANYNGGPI